MWHIRIGLLTCIVSVPKSLTVKRACCATSDSLSATWTCDHDWPNLDLASPRDHTMTGVGAPNARQLKFTVRPNAAFTTDGDASMIDGGSADSALAFNTVVIANWFKTKKTAL